MINPSLIAFLQELAQNNNREWFQDHKDEHKRLNQEFIEYLTYIAEQVAHFDAAVEARMGDPKLVKVFRIYRDTRFAKNKSPYKTNCGGTISAGGEAYPMYYLHIEPGKSFAGGGIYMPSPTVLSSLREKIDEEYKRLDAIVDADAFKAVFPNGLDREGALKTSPKGYSKDHPAIHLLRLKSFVAIRSFTDQELFKDTFTNALIDTFETLYPLHGYLRP